MSGAGPPPRGEGAGGLWRPSASWDVLRLRAALLARIRGWFAARDLLEVETPVLSAAGTTDPQIESFTTHYHGPGAPYGCTAYLHTSPEFPMKRLLAAGSGSIYQICRVFRQGEAGARHNPEFTLVEWYCIGADHHTLMDEVQGLVTEVLAGSRSLGEPERMSYRTAFERHVGVDPHGASPAQLRTCAARHGLETGAGLGDRDADPWRDLLLSHLVVPHLGRGRLSLLYDYPASQASLARVRPGDPPVAERFEVFLDGMELANGFHELADAGEQHRRFERDRYRRRTAGQPSVAPDERLLAALVAGLPDCAGVALGFDRLVMAACGARRLEEVLAFPFERA
ncbi:MAG TPA: EF-P lysine aminoacylase GenX [Chromatiales bacterium]|nr:EF-P lysine aminoacylase GenX [Chromatiales bacterium]